MSKINREPTAAGTREMPLEYLNVVASPEHVSCDLEGEAVILHVGTGVYYGLNGVGSRVWSLIQAPTTAAAVRDALVSEYDVDRDVCERDLRALLRELSERKLATVTADSSE